MIPLPYKFRRKLTVIYLLIILPIYIGLVVSFMLSFGERLPFLLELLLYIFFGLVWIVPLKYIARGVGKEEPSKSSGQLSGSKKNV